jgi:thioredoxin-like negative regulator of GroEL
MADATNDSLLPLLEALSREFAGRVSIGYLDIDELPPAFSRIQFEGSLTLVFFCLGESFSHVFGIHALPSLKRWLTQSLHACAAYGQTHRSTETH